MRQAYDYWQDQPGFCVPSAACCSQRLGVHSRVHEQPHQHVRGAHYSVRDWTRIGRHPTHKAATNNARHQHGGLDNVKHLQCNKSNAPTCGLPFRKRPSPKQEVTMLRCSRAPPLSASDNAAVFTVIAAQWVQVHKQNWVRTGVRFHHTG